jgi:ribosomal protein S18 acetylase RimI-like enzyme
MVEYRTDTADWRTVAQHLARCDADFVPPLSGRVVLEDYARKIAANAARFEAWSGGTLVGLVAAYLDDGARRAFITSVSVLRERTGEGIAGRLMRQCIEHATAAGLREIRLEVAGDNAPALRLYRACGFVACAGGASLVTMALELENRDSHERQA